MNRIFTLLCLMIITLSSHAQVGESPAKALDKMIEHQTEAIEMNKANKGKSTNKEFTKFFNDMIAEQEKDLKKMHITRKKLFPDVKSTTPSKDRFSLFSRDIEEEIKNFQEKIKMALSKFNSKIDNDKGNPLSPKVEIKEDEKSYEVKAEVPGIARDDIKVKIKDNDIMITAKRESEVKHSSATSTSSEFHYGNYERTIHLDEKVDPKSMKVEIKDGIVDVRLKKVHPGENTRRI